MDSVFAQASALPQIRTRLWAHIFLNKWNSIVTVKSLNTRKYFKTLDKRNSDCVCISVLYVKIVGHQTHGKILTNRSIMVITIIVTRFCFLLRLNVVYCNMCLQLLHFYFVYEMKINSLIIYSILHVIIKDTY